MRSFIASAAVAVSAASALAQYSGGVNVDINTATGVGAGQPTILFGGAAGQAGYWNPVNPPLSPGGSVTLRNLANSADAVTMSWSWGSAATRTAINFNNPNTTGDTELLLDDLVNLGVPSNGPHTFSFGPFAPGLYRVVTYAVAPDSPIARTDVEVLDNQGSAGVQSVGGEIPAGGSLPLGVTHAMHDLPHYTPTSIRVIATPSVSFGSISGFQIQRLAPTRLYVKTGVSGSGLAWSSPIGNLQAALAIAQVTPSVTEIWVAAGTYYTDAFPAAAGDGTASFTMRSNLAIYGGFAGFESSTISRDLNNPAYETTLDGHGIAQIVVRGSGVTGVVVDGFTVAHGHTAFGFTASTASLERCIARDNNADTGAFVDAVSNSNVTVRRCAAVNNYGAGSGAILHLLSGGTLDVADTLIANNNMGLNLFDGGTGAHSFFRNCTFANNRGPNPGDLVRVYCAPDSVVRNCIFWGTIYNGAPASEYGFGGVLDNVNWTNSTVTDNIIQGWTGTLSGPADANNGADPRFTAPVTAGISATPVLPLYYTLASRSPARDSGWNAGAVGLIDYFGNPRLIDDPYMPNTGFSGGYVDRGFAEASTDSAICPGDLGHAGGLVGPDGLRDNNDFIAFITLFFAADSRADLGRAGGLAGSDGLYDNNDFIAFINAFFSPCP